MYLIHAIGDGPLYRQQEMLRIVMIEGKPFNPINKDALTKEDNILNWHEVCRFFGPIPELNK